MNRTTEFVLGLIGGIIGFFAAILALFIGGVDAAFSSDGTSEVTGLGWAAFLFSALAIVGSVVVKSKAKAGGILLLISAVGGLISISMFYLISAVLIGIAGFMGIFKKEKEKQAAA
ncbi:DUF4064 domain-containing protein [Virgibacillus dakarensis]|uniref:DUF4064 domain-containing protein n=1 Tax=Lentibacillus populi TaxID=1827502 RepID=A0A9W5X4J6_9BACI|nr:MULTISPECIES: DUF4064 domain-containing protein [Bacillaceae]MBT2218422.1 DUF4064 domain-containing protein [Virgibacillus dakarensis]MTW87485.1 DUF4064 domain-containing protein [Virgibacillus dakarensis]GGA16112.1 hypothetical protein GCM10011408_42370 [Dyella caseinilytica]GGB35756.1 hypothetical protein GCM10011409_11530 [Lentibacillus populi]